LTINLTIDLTINLTIKADQRDGLLPLSGEFGTDKGVLRS
jgi:hypothetical protein